MLYHCLRRWYDINPAFDQCPIPSQESGTEALVYINHPREAAASTSLAIIFGADCQWHTLVSPFDNDADAALNWARRTP